jgi:FKBP-type peptidyl-prolyl cis-trans isomerase SlpA
MHIEKGSQVTFHFTLSLSTGQVADSTRDKEPMTLVVGEEYILPGLENRLIGLKAGDKQRFEIPYQEAFGPADPERVHNIPRSEFSAELNVTPGQVILFTAPNGDEAAGTVMEITDETVTVDFSHSLAGHDLIFEVEILEVQLGADSEAESKSEA